MFRMMNREEVALSLEAGKAVRLALAMNSSIQVDHYTSNGNVYLFNDYNSKTMDMKISYNLWAGDRLKIAHEDNSIMNKCITFTSHASLFSSLLSTKVGYLTT